MIKGENGLWVVKSSGTYFFLGKKKKALHNTNHEQILASQGGLCTWS
jgi:hypothetical protein